VGDVIVFLHLILCCHFAHTEVCSCAYCPFLEYRFLSFPLVFVYSVFNLAIRQFLSARNVFFGSHHVLSSNQCLLMRLFLSLSTFLPTCVLLRLGDPHYGVIILDRCVFQDAGVLRIKELLDESKRIQISLGDGGVSGVFIAK